MPANYNYKVELEGNTGFVLDTDLLDTGVLGYLAKDITSYVRSVSVRRGKSTNLDEFTAGQMSVSFDNRSRAFDPSYTSSPLYGSIVPRRHIKFYIADQLDPTEFVQQFDGYVDDWNFTYDVSGDSVAVAACSDAFTLLANQDITLTTPAAELSGDRIQRVLTGSTVLFNNRIDQQGAAFTMDSVSYSGNVLQYAQNVAASERGYFFISQQGFARYLGWNSFTLATNPYLFTDTKAVSTDGGYPFTSIETTYGTEQLYNYVTVTGSGGTVTSQNVTSQNTYGIASETFSVVTAGTAQMQVLADYVISNYKDPRFRVSQIDVSLDDPNVRDTSGYLGIYLLLNVDIGDSVSVVWKPNQIGTATSYPGFVIGKNIDAQPGACTVSFSVSSNDFRSIYP